MVDRYQHFLLIKNKMAQRRMFSRRITSSARFLKMPQESQNLYFHLCMNADDDGIVEAFTIMQILGSNEDNIRILNAKGFIRALNEDMVTYITDWREHNLIRADRKVNSIYKDLLIKIIPEVDVIEPKPRADTGVIPKQSTGRPLDGIGKDRLGKVSLIQSDEKKLKPTYEGRPVSDKFGKLMVKGLDNEWRDFNGSREDIVWS